MPNIDKKWSTTWTTRNCRGQCSSKNIGIVYAICLLTSQARH